MENRLFIESDAFPNLPDEIAIHVMQFLRVQELLALNLTSRDCSRVARDNELWKQLYIQHFGPLVSTEEAKLQYIVAYIFKKATDETRLDRKQILFLHLQKMLVPYAEKPWAKYYLGDMQYFGMGIRANKHAALALLMQGADSGDYKAIMQLIKIMENCIDHRDRDFIFHEIGLARLKTFVSVLTNAYANRARSTALTLGIMHLKGIGVETDTTIAEHWFNCALEAEMPEAINELLEIESNPADDDEPVDILHFLDLLSTRFPSSRVLQAEICYQRAQEYLNQDRKQQALNALVQAQELGHVIAIRELGAICLDTASRARKKNVKQKHLHLAIDYFKTGFRMNDAACTGGFFNAKTQSYELDGIDPSLVIDDLYQGFLKGNPLAATLINSFNCSREFENALAHHPEQIIWMQIAAMSGCSSAFEKLIALSNASNPSPYVDCALGMIFTFGAYYSDNIQSNAEKAKDYFSSAYMKDPLSIKNYLEAGKQMGVLCEEVQKALEQEVEKYTVSISCKLV